MNRTRYNKQHAVNASLQFYNAAQQQQQQQQSQQLQQQQQQQQQQQPVPHPSTAKLPIDTVKQLISAVSRRPNLWIRHHSGQKRYDINQLWLEVSKETNLPADICRIKWGHLRDNFRKVFIRNTLSDETPTTWRFYNDMRFMEKSVAENIMRQHRYKDQTRYWPEFIQSPQQSLHPTIPICTIKENGELSAKPLNVLDDYIPSDKVKSNKRIKLEPQDGSYEQSHLQYTSQQNGYEHGQQERQHTEAEPDDDDFDEDTATEETDNTNCKEKHNDGKNPLFSLDTYDIDEDVDHLKRNMTKSHSNYNNGMSTESMSMEDEHSNNYSTANLKKTGPFSAYTEEQDSDRLFLLSLLPYLRSIDVNRKLRVRHRLQNVLIEELQ